MDGESNLEDGGACHNPWRMSPTREDAPKGPALKAPSVRLFVLLARRARRAVVFRRGPSRQVLLLSWDTASDVLTPGQWFKGRIYERRCDLSPSGDKLVYFAGKFRKPYATWTAVSRPPWLTALALWPHGDAWGGGGLFESDPHLRLHHRSTQMQLAPDFHLPKHFQVEQLGNQETRLGRLDWADWDSNGDLLFARDGRLYRIDPERKDGAVDVSEPQEVADLRGYIFENRLAPPSATQW